MKNSVEEQEERNAENGKNAGVYGPTRGEREAMRLLSFFASERIYSLFSKCSKRGRRKRKDRKRDR